MGGEGSMKAMNDSIKANRNLRRKKSFFSRQRSFLNRKKEYYKAAEGKVNIVSATKEELAEIRKKIIKQRKKENLLIIILVLILVIPFCYFSYNYFQTHTSSTEKIDQEELALKTEKYLYFITDGDTYLEKGHWHNAIFQYKKALEVFPNDYEAQYRIAYVYVYSCRNENKNCQLAQERVVRLLKFFPEKPEILELQEELNSL